MNRPKPTPQATPEQLIADTRTAEIDGKHWVVSSDRNGHEMERRGPYRNADEAETAARCLIQVGRTLRLHI